jgi:hypothetical protein
VHLSIVLVVFVIVVVIAMTVSVSVRRPIGVNVFVFVLVIGLRIHARLLSSLPQAPVADRDVQDRSQAPQQSYDRPKDFFPAVEIVPADDIENHEDQSDRMQDDRDQDLQQRLQSGLFSLRSGRRAPRWPPGPHSRAHGLVGCEGFCLKSGRWAALAGPWVGFMRRL